MQGCSHLALKGGIKIQLNMGHNVKKLEQKQKKVNPKLYSILIPPPTIEIKDISDSPAWLASELLPG